MTVQRHSGRSGKLYAIIQATQLDRSIKMHAKTNFVVLYHPYHVNVRPTRLYYCIGSY